MSLIAFIAFCALIAFQGWMLFVAHRRIDKLEERAKHLEESKDGIFFAISEIHKDIEKLRR